LHTFRHTHTIYSSNAHSFNIMILTDRYIFNNIIICNGNNNKVVLLFKFGRRDAINNTYTSTHSAFLNIRFMKITVVEIQHDD